MSRRTIVALAASVIFGMGFILTVSTEASAYYRGGVYRGGVYRGGAYRGGYYRGGYYRGVRPGVAVGVGAAAVGAAAVGAAAAGAYYAPGYYAPRPVACGCLLRARLLCATASSMRILSLPSVLLTALSHRRLDGRAVACRNPRKRAGAIGACAVLLSEAARIARCHQCNSAAWIDQRFIKARQPVPLSCGKSSWLAALR